MKKLLVILLAALAINTATTQQAAAQNKFGYFDLEYVVGLMPGVAKVDTLMAFYERDSIGAEYDFRMGEFQRADSILKKDSATMPAKLYQTRKEEQVQRFIVLQNWQSYSQQAMQSKQQELMAPFLNRALEAFQTVVSEGKYTYVFKRESMWIAPPADNLIPLVLKKLKITDPNAPPPAAPAPKAPAKPAGKN
jgi:Skp family chaperone for outer membrane proteins